MCQTIILGLSTILAIVGFYFTTLAPTCVYSTDDENLDTCPDTIPIFDINTQELCQKTPCIYQGYIGAENNHVSIQAFCHWSSPAIEILGFISLVAFFIASIFSLGIYYKNKTFNNKVAIVTVTLVAGIIGLAVSILAFVDVGQNGCSNKEFQEILHGRKTPFVHYAWASLEFIMAITLLISAAIAARPTKIIIPEKKEIEDIRNSLIRKV